MTPTSGATSSRYFGCPTADRILVALHRIDTKTPNAPTPVAESRPEMPTTDTRIADPAPTLVADRCEFFETPHAHLWEYTNGHLVCAFCDEKRPFTT